MSRLLLSLALLSGSIVYGQSSSPLSLYVHDTTGALPDTPLPAFYQLASTAMGASSHTVLKMVNTSTNNVFFSTALVSTSPTSSALNSNFSVTGVFVNQLLVPGASVLYIVNFTPTSTGVINGYLNLAYQVQQNGCVLSGTGSVCPGNLVNVSTLNGTATAPVLSLAYQTASGPVNLTPSSSSPLNYPSTSLSSTNTFTFILTNSSSVDVTVPSITLPVQNSTQPGAFTISSPLPTDIPAQSSANFTVTFAPSQIGLAVGVLQIGPNSYPIQGYGIVVATIDILQISYTSSTGVRTLPQAATPIPFPQVVPGSGASAVLTFNILNPSTSANAVSIPAISISGATFSLSGLPALPVSIAPGASINFGVAFTPVSVGAFTGSLAIGSRSFSLTGTAISSTIPGISITTSGTVASQQQLNLIVQLSTPSQVAALGTLTMKFSPSIANVTDDAAIQFLATNGRQLNISIASGAQAATYNNQSSIAFQTGTTGGTLTFSVAFPNTPTYTQTFTVPSAIPAFTNVQATRESPNLLVTVDGFDNTYSAGVVSFTFYDTNGNVVGSPISYDGSANFKQLFFTGNTDGGLFSLQANFPVNGDVTKIGKVTVSLANSAGTTSQSAAFQ